MPGYPNRCQHLKINGTQCGSPALRRNRFCFFHKRFQDERIRLNAARARSAGATFVLPLLEDANSIQVALMQVMRLLISQQIEHKTASLLLYALQTASTNLRMTKFDPFVHEVILDPRDAADSPLNVTHLWDDDDFEEEEEDEDEVKTQTDRAIAALEKAKEKRQDEDKWMRWAERQYPRPKPEAAQSSAPQPPAAPAPKQKGQLLDLKKPPAHATPAEVRAQISAMVRQSLPELTKVLVDAKEKEKEEKQKKQSPKQAT